MSDLTFLLDIEHCDPADATDTGTEYYSDATYGTGSGDTPADTPFLEILDGVPPRVLELGTGGLASGPTQPRRITANLKRYQSGENQLTALDGRNILGRSGYLRVVGVGGDGTVWTLDNPAVVANGANITTSESSRDISIGIQPHVRAHQIKLPRSRLLGYPNGLRGNGNTSEADVPYNTVPTALTLVALVLTPQVWTVGATDHQTIFGQDSVHAYFEETGTNERRLMLDVRNAANTAWHTLTGSAFDPDEDVHAMSWRFNTSTLATRFGLDSTFEDITAPADFGALTANWKLGRLQTSLTDVFDTIAGGFALFDAWLTDSEVVDVISERMTGSEDNLLWFFPGETAAGDILDYAAVNAAAPLDATLTDATAAPLFTGTAQLAGVALNEVTGYVQNAPMVPIDPSRKIYRIGNDVGAIFDVFDRGVPYAIEAAYSSPLDFADNPPTVSGNVTTCPHMGGLVRVHTEVDGVENTADCGGLGLYDFSLNLGFLVGGGSRVTWGTTDLDTVYLSPPWAQEIFYYWDGVNLGTKYIWTSSFWQLLTNASSDPDVASYSVFVYLDDATFMEVTFQLERRIRVAFKVEAWEDAGDAHARVLMDGNVIGSATAAGKLLRTAASTLVPALGGPTLGFTADHFGVLPVRLWSTVAATDAAAEDAQRLYLFNNPGPSTTGLEGLWYRHTGDQAVLVDETTNSNDGTVDSGAVWGPKPGCVSPISAARSLLTDAGVTVTLRDSAYDAIGGASGRFINTEKSIAQAAAEILDGAGLYLLLNPDGTATIGLQPDPATATPVGTLFVDDPHPAEVNDLPPSLVRCNWGPNPTVQTSVLAGADDDRKSFASQAWRTTDYEIGTNRQVYADEDPPNGRRLEINTGFVSQSAAKAEAARRGEIWKNPRPVRRCRVLGRLDTDGSLLGEGGGFNTIEVGEVYTIRWREPDPVLDTPTYVEETVQVLSLTQTEESDEILVR